MGDSRCGQVSLVSIHFLTHLLRDPRPFLLPGSLVGVQALACLGAPMVLNPCAKTGRIQKKRPCWVTRFRPESELKFAKRHSGGTSNEGTVGKSLLLGLRSVCSGGGGWDGGRSRFCQRGSGRFGVRRSWLSGCSSRGGDCWSRRWWSGRGNGGVCGRLFHGSWRGGLRACSGRSDSGCWSRSVAGWRRCFSGSGSRKGWGVGSFCGDNWRFCLRRSRRFRNGWRFEQTGRTSRLVFGDQNGQHGSQEKQRDRQVNGEFLQHVGGLSTKHLAGHVSTEGSTESLLTGTLHEDNEDEEKADDDFNNRQESDQDGHKGGGNMAIQIGLASGSAPFSWNCSY